MRGIVSTAKELLEIGFGVREEPVTRRDMGQLEQRIATLCHVGLVSCFGPDFLVAACSHSGITLRPMTVRAAEKPR